MTTPAVSAYSTTPANNTQANTGVNWDEGMSPAAVNNSARQNMADLRSFANDLIWFPYGSGTSPVVTPVYVGATQFKIAGVDVSAVYHVGRRVKAVGSGTGTIYGRISAVAFSTDTTVTVVWDSGSLSNETLTIYISQIPVTGNPLPYVPGTFTPTDGSPAALTFTSAFGFSRTSPGFITVWGRCTYPVTSDSNEAAIAGLPVAAANLSVGSGFQGIVQFGGGGGLPGGSGPNWAFVQPNTSNISFRYAGGLIITNAMLSTYIVNFCITYPI
jgi:hypothetical protein